MSFLLGRIAFGKQVFHGSIFENCGNDKELFHLVNCLTTDTGLVLPETRSNASLAENFSRFFDFKIDTLRNDHFSHTNIDVVFPNRQV